MHVHPHNQMALLTASVFGAFLESSVLITIDTQILDSFKVTSFILNTSKGERWWVGCEEGAVRPNTEQNSLP